jgi:hypothetical protein
VTAKLPAWLSAASERGSGDDISLGFMIGSASLVTRPPVTGARPVESRAPVTGTTRSARVPVHTIALAAAALAAIAAAAGGYYAWRNWTPRPGSPAEKRDGRPAPTRGSHEPERLKANLG